MSETDYRNSKPTLLARLPHGMRRVNWMLGIWSFFVLLFLYFPILILIIWSFNSAKYGSKWESGTTIWYRSFWASCMIELRDWADQTSWFHWMSGIANSLGAENGRAVLKQIPTQISGSIPAYVETLANSVYIGVISTFVSVFLGTVSAWLTFKYKFKMHNVLNTLIAVPMIVPEIIMGVGLLSFFSLSFQYLEKIGFNPGLGYFTVLIGHITFSFPFVMVTIQARLAGIDPALEEAAMDLGATPQQAFRLVIVPYLLPAIISGALMAFTLSLDDFVVTYFIKSASAETLPIRIYGSVKGPPPMMHVVSTIMIGLTVLMVVIAEGIKRINR